MWSVFTIRSTAADFSLQVQRLEKDLNATDKSTILFSHASLYHPENGIKNREQVHAVLAEANRKAGVPEGSRLL